MIVELAGSQPESGNSLGDRPVDLTSEAKLAMLTIDAPTGSLPNFLRAEIPGEVMLWEPAGTECGESAWHMAGRGVAARWDADGIDRMREIRERANAVLNGIDECREPVVSHAPAVRVFGGVAFGVGSTPPESPWAPFGAASFVIPRWIYGEREGRAFARLCVNAAELAVPANLESEIASMRSALSRKPVSLPDAGDESAAMLDEETSPETWAAQVESALAAIRKGALSKVVLTRRTHVRMANALDLGRARERLADIDPDCLRFAIQRGDATFLGGTPERLVELRGKLVVCNALGGSLPRGGDEIREAAQLLGSAKDRREHQAVVDGIHDSLSSFCYLVESDGQPIIRTLRSIHHLHTPITGHLRHETHILDIVSALHPTPAVSGLPRAAAERWISTHEKSPRGWYAAPVGWFDAAGSGCFAVGIRSALVHGRDAWLFAGCGIVEGSEPALEYAEGSAKQRTMLDALGLSA